MITSALTRADADAPHCALGRSSPLVGSSPHVAIVTSIPANERFNTIMSETFGTLVAASRQMDRQHHHVRLTTRVARTASEHIDHAPFAARQRSTEVDRCALASLHTGRRSA